MALNQSPHAIPITDESNVGEARRLALSVSKAAGLNASESGGVAIAVTEAASNVLKHARTGEILLRELDSGVEVLAIDKGPGIADIPAAMADWRSTAGTAGIGLGAISRLATTFDLYTGSGLGTVLLAVFRAASYRPATQFGVELQIGCVQVPFPGETACGDGWAMAGTTMLMVDGLGHGHHAEVAARQAIAVFQENSERPVQEVIEAIHRALRNTRGAAVAIAQMDYYRHSVHFCGLGNVSGVIVSDGTRRGMMSHNGTAGHEVRRIVALDYAWPDSGLLIMHTDGISTKWDLDSYPGLSLRHPALIAAVVYRDFRRRTDDATVLVARVCPPMSRGGA